MNKPTNETIDAVAPAYDIDGMTLSDGYSVRNVAHAEQRDTLRLPRGGPFSASLVASRKYYDGSGGGEAGHYALLFVEFQSVGSRWRTAGVKVRAVEAARVATHMLRGVPSKPGRSEPPRVGGKETPTDGSELRGIAAGKGKTSYLLFVRHELRSGAFGRTRGVEVLGDEKASLAGLLRVLAATMKEV